MKGNIRSEGPIINMFVYPFDKYVVNTYYVLGIDVSPGDAAVNKVPALMEPCYSI